MKKISGNVRNYPSDSKLPSSTVLHLLIKKTVCFFNCKFFTLFVTKNFDLNPDSDSLNPDSQH